VLADRVAQRDGTARPSAFIDTFEPGSVAKILRRGGAAGAQTVRPGEHVSAKMGTLPSLGRPPITDEDPQPTLTLADAIRVSSNIAMVNIPRRA